MTIKKRTRKQITHVHAQQIQHALAAGMSPTAIRSKFGFSFNTIKAIKNGSHRMVAALNNAPAPQEQAPLPVARPAAAAAPKPTPIVYKEPVRPEGDYVMLKELVAEQMLEIMRLRRALARYDPAAATSGF